MAQTKITLADNALVKAFKVNEMLAEIAGRPLTKFEKVSYRIDSIEGIAHKISNIVGPTGAAKINPYANITVGLDALNEAFEIAYDGGGTPGPTLAALTLAANQIVEGSASGTVVGGILGKTVNSSFSLINNAGGRFALSGSGQNRNLISSSTLTDFEAAQFHDVTVKETLPGATNSGLETTLRVNVTNVNENPNLNTLGFSTTNFILGTPLNGAITGATANEAIDKVGNLPSGVSINGPSRTFAWSGTGVSATTNVTLRGILGDSANSPKDSTFAITIAESTGGGGTPASYIAPSLTPQNTASSFPPHPLLVTNAYHPVGAKLHVRVAPTYADLVAGTNLSVDDATFTLTADPTTNQNGLWAKLAGISSGKSFIGVRVEESSTVFSEWSVPIMHGSVAVPAPQASINFGVYSSFPLSATVTFAEPVYIEILGDDQLSLELVGAQPNTNFTLQWRDNIAKYYDPLQPNGNDDFNVDHVYDYILRRRSLAGVLANSAGAVTLQDYDTTPDAFSFTPVTGAALGALVPLDSTVFSGMANGYGAPLTLSGAWEKFKVNTGSGFGADLTSTDGVTLQDGHDLRVYVRASSSNLTLARAIATVGGVSANADVTTIADASSVAPTAQDWTRTAAISGGDGATTNPIPLTLKAGLNVVFVRSNFDATGATIAGSTSVTKINTGAFNRLLTYEVVMPSNASGSLFLTGENIATQPVESIAVSLTNAQPGPIGIQSLAFGFHPAPIEVGTGTTVASGNLGIVVGFNYGATPIGWNNATLSKGFAPSGIFVSLAVMTTDGLPSMNADGYSGDGGIVAVWRKA